VKIKTWCETCQDFCEVAGDPVRCIVCGGPGVVMTDSGQYKPASFGVSARKDGGEVAADDRKCHDPNGS
jgi:hypothetical protein